MNENLSISTFSSAKLTKFKPVLNLTESLSFFTVYMQEFYLLNILREFLFSSITETLQQNSNIMIRYSYLYNLLSLTFCFIFSIFIKNYLIKLTC